MLTAFKLISEGSDQMGAFLCWVVLGVRFYSCLFFRIYFNDYNLQVGAVGLLYCGFSPKKRLN